MRAKLVGGQFVVTLTSREAQRLGVVAQAPAAPEVEVKPHYFTKAEIEAGGGYPCLLGCQKRTRSLERSLQHATTNAELQQFGHIEVPA